MLKSPGDRVRKVLLAAITFLFILLKEQEGPHFQRDLNSSFCLDRHKSRSCAFPHLDSAFLLNGSKSLANIFAFGNSSSPLLQQPHASTGVRRGSAGGGSLLRAPTAPGAEKGFAFLPFPPAGGIPGAGWERNPGHCWNGEGDDAHSFTTLWAGLALACYLTR